MDMQGMMNTSMMVLTKPSQSSFKSAKGSVNTTNTLVGLIVAGAISGLLAGFRSGGAGIVSGLIGGVTLTVIGFYFFNAVTWVIAKVLGGSGGFMLQCNLLATFYVPLVVVSAILGLIPLVGALIGLLLFLYALYLAILGLQVAHNYSIAKAIVTVLFTLFIVSLIYVVVGGTIFLLLGLASPLP